MCVCVSNSGVCILLDVGKENYLMEDYFIEVNPDT